MHTGISFHIFLYIYPTFYWYVSKQERGCRFLLNYRYLFLFITGYQKKLGVGGLQKSPFN